MKQMDEQYELDVVSIRMVKDASFYSDTPWDNPKKVVNALGEKLIEMDREVFCVINVTTKSRPINCSIVSVGVLDGCLVSPREIFKTSILSNASGIVLLHNHPSGNMTPSQQDILLTKRMAVACNYMGIELLDHIIVGTEEIGYFSFKENGILPKPLENKKQEAVLTGRTDR